MLDALVAVTADTRFADLPPTARDAAKLFLLDCLAIGVAGRRTVYRDPLLKAVTQWGDGATARVMGDSARLPAPSAAFMNAYQMHCLEFDCVHEPAVAHVMTSPVAAALAEYEQTERQIDGERLLAAIVVGAEVATTLGLAAKAPLTFFRPATTGVFGAAATVAMLRDFEPHMIRSAFGYALAHAAGTMQAHEEGKPTLPIQLANAARAGLMSADLAGTGIPSPEQSIEGKHGYLALFETTTDIAGLAASVGMSWRVTELSIKPYPSGRATHAGIDAVCRLRDLGVTADNVVGLHLTAPPLIHQLVMRPATADMNVNYARLCLPYVSAVALRHGAVGLADFEPEQLRDEQSLSLAACYSAEVGGASDPAAFAPQTLRATLRDGSHHTVTIDTLPGSPASPLTDAQHREKVTRCLAWTYGDSDRAERLIDACEQLPDQPNLETLFSAITGCLN